MVTRKVLKNFLVQLFVQNAWNFASEQRPGITLILSSRSRSGRVITPPRAAFNTNPYLASFLTGVLVREMQRSGIEDISSVLETSLAAQGDDLYWRILRPTALLAGILCVLLGQPVVGLLLFLSSFNLLAQGERLVGYVRGLRKGKAGLGELMASMTLQRRIFLPVAGVLVGVIAAAMIFNLPIEAGFVQGLDWYIFTGLFALALIFALLRIPPLLNLIINIVLLVLLEVFL